MRRERPRHSAESTPNRLMEALSYLGYVVLGVALALAIRTWLFSPVRVVGWSMEPTLYQDDIMIITPSSYRFHEPERFDIIVLDRPNAENILLVKRIIGLPGDRVEIKDGLVYINGNVLSDDIYGAEPMYYSMAELTVPEDHIFVLGDNRNQSTDSHELGTIPISSIRGKVQFHFPFGSNGQD